MKKVSWIGLVTVLALLLLVVAAACGKPAAPAPTVTVTKTVTVTPTPTPVVRPAWELDPVIIAAAKKEGTLTIAGFQTTADQRALRARFNAEYPEIKMEFILEQAPETAARLKAEKAAGKGTVDVFMTSMRAGMLVIGDDMAERLDPPELKNSTAKWVMHPITDPLAYGEPLMVLASSHLMGVGINTKLVPPGQEPRTWMELFTEPKWKGKVAMGQPNKGVALAVAYFFWTEGGEGLKPNLDLIEKKVKQQNIFMSADEIGVSEMVARGEYAVMVGTQFDYVRIPAEAGLPVKWIVPEEGAMSVGWYQMISKLAPHKNAAKLFVNWILTENGQKAWSEAGRVPVRAGIVPPAGMPAVPAEKLTMPIGRSASDRLTPLSQLMQKAFGL